MKITKHSAFTTRNGINQVMKIYEQLILEIPEKEIEILHQHNGKTGKIVVGFSQKW